MDVVPSTSDAAQPPSSKWRFQGTRGCSFAIEMKDESDKNSVVINISSEVMKPSQQIIEREKDVTPTYLLNFAWISALTLSQVQTLIVLQDHLLSPVTSNVTIATLHVISGPGTS